MAPRRFLALFFLLALALTAAAQEGSISVSASRDMGAVTALVAASAAAAAAAAAAEAATRPPSPQTKRRSVLPDNNSPRVSLLTWVIGLVTWKAA